MKGIILLLSILLLWLQYIFWFGKNGVCDFIRIKQSAKIQEYNQFIANLKIRNSQLLSEINDLIHEQEEVIEERARYELNMIKSDEVFYHLIFVNKK